MTARERIVKLLENGFSPLFLEVRDISAQHEGHAAHRPGEVTHVEIILVSDMFAGKTLVERHRLVYQALEPEIHAGLHALKLKTLTVAEGEKRKLFADITKG